MGKAQDMSYIGRKMWIFFFFYT